MILSWSRKLVDALFSTSRRVGRRTVSQKADFRPQLESLENRTLLSAGALDPRFGSGGTAIIPFPTPNGPPSAASATAIAMQGDKSVLVGSDFNTPDGLGDFAVARLNKNGSLDSSFGSGGEVTIDFGGLDMANAVAVDGDKIVVAGFSVNFNTGQQVMTVARLNRDGSLDSSFGSGGEVLVNFTGNDAAQGVAIQGNKIVLAGTTFLTNGNEAVAVARLNRDGSLDGSFGSGGEVTFGFGGGSISAANAATIQDGRIVVAGGTNTTSPFGQWAVARLNNDGSLDNQFGTGGITLVAGTNGQASSMALQGEQIVLAGPMSDGSGTERFGVARLTENGSLDSSFGSGGVVTVAFPGFGSFANAVTVQGDKIVVAGFNQTVDSSDVAVARLNGDGSLDSSFGSGGEVTTALAGNLAFGAGVAIQGDDIIVAGTFVNQTTGENDFLAVAYLKN